MDKLAYSLREATEVTGIGKTKLYELIKDGKLRVTRIGGRTIIPAEALIKLVNTGRG